MRKIKKKWVLICAVLVVAAVFPAFFGNQVERYQKKDFVDNGLDLPYSQGVPLEDMQFRVYAKYVEPKANAAVLANWKVLIALPCDVRYYVHKTDDAPAITLKKGTEVYIYPHGPRGTRRDFVVGHGLYCWPDYQKGWRYGQPFSEDRNAEAVPLKSMFENSSMYFVRTEELERVAVAFYRANGGVPKLSENEFAFRITRFIDRELFRCGAFCSEELVNPPLFAKGGKW